MIFEERPASYSIWNRLSSGLDLDTPQANGNVGNRFTCDRSALSVDNDRCERFSMR